MAEDKKDKAKDGSAWILWDRGEGRLAGGPFPTEADAEAAQEGKQAQAARTDAPGPLFATVEVPVGKNKAEKKADEDAAKAAAKAEEDAQEAFDAENAQPVRIVK